MILLNPEYADKIGGKCQKLGQYEREPSAKTKTRDTKKQPFHHRRQNPLVGIQIAFSPVGFSRRIIFPRRVLLMHVAARVKRMMWPLPIIFLTALSLFAMIAIMPVHAEDTALAGSAGCQALQAKYPMLKGKTLVNALTPHTPGYEALDPQDPSRYIGFDIDLAEALGSCLGFKLTYKPVAFAALLPTLQSGQADLVISDIYATSERAKAADFITYSKVFDGVLVAKGNPKHITGINTSLCGNIAAENTGFVEVPLVQNLAPECKAFGKPEPSLQLYDNNADCIQAILAGRADTYINDVNTVDQAVKAYPDKLSKAVAVTLPYSIGIAVPKNKPELRAAIMAALIEVQKAGVETSLLKKWSLDAGSIEEPRLVTQ